MVWSPTLHSKELVNECYSACSMDHQATTGENAQKNRKKKKFKQWNICHLVASWRKCSNCWVASLYCNPSEDYFFTEGDGTPLQYSCLENPMDRGAWWAAVHGVVMSWTWMSDFTFTFHFHALEKDMAIHSSILAWRIPGTGEPDGLLSMGSQSWTRLKRLSSSSNIATYVNRQ